MKPNYTFKRTLSALVLLMASSLAWAYDFKAENADGVTIYYRLINDGTEAEVVSGDNTSIISPSYFDEVINIPETVAYNGKTLSVTSIGNGAFQYCSSLTSVTIPASVKSIGSSAFATCSGLTSITIPESVTSIGHSAFYWCKGLTSVNISASVTSIGNEAFQYCSGLTSVTIPAGVTSIGEYAFSRCSSLTSVYSRIEHPFSISSIVFKDITNDATFYVPQGTKDAYESAGWTGYFSRVVEE